MVQSTVRDLRCHNCRVWCRTSDMTGSLAPTHCWPCWIAWLRETRSRYFDLDEQLARMPRGWYSRCERCEVRTWGTEDRALCPPCSRVLARWRATLRKCRWCSTIFRGSNGHNKLCCAHRVREERMAAAKAIATHTAEEWAEVLRTFNYRCAYCGEPGTSKDHVVPISRGGSDGIENIVPACQPCNSSKHNRLLDEWEPKKNSGPETCPKCVRVPDVSLVTGGKTLAYKTGALPIAPRQREGQNP